VVKFLQIWVFSRYLEAVYFAFSYFFAPFAVEFLKSNIAADAYGIIDKISITITNFLADPAWFEPLTQRINTERNGLLANGRAAAWGLDSWPAAIAGETFPFIDRTESFTLTLALVNGRGEAIDSLDLTVSGGWVSKSGLIIIPNTLGSPQTAAFAPQDSQTASAPLSIKISAVNGTPAAGTSRITAITEAQAAANPAITGLANLRKFVIDEKGTLTAYNPEG
jgi:hypothetical protein